MRRVGDLVSRNWWNFPERIRRSLTLKSSESFLTINMEEFAEERRRFIFPLSIGRDRLTPKVTGHSLKNIRADFVMCSGWLKFVRGLDPARTVNIHPGPLPQFGGPGMYGHHVHEAVMAAYHRGEITQSALTMHFVDEIGYDNGQIIFQMPVLIRPDDDAEDTGRKSKRKRARLAKSYFKQGRPWAYLP